MNGITLEDQEAINYFNKNLNKKDRKIFTKLIISLTKDPMDAFNQEITDTLNDCLSESAINDCLSGIDAPELLMPSLDDADMKKLIDSLSGEINFPPNINSERLSLEELSTILAESTIITTTDHAGMRVNTIQHPIRGKVTTVQGEDGGLLFSSL
jgi:hypothetical protein